MVICFYRVGLILAQIREPEIAFTTFERGLLSKRLIILTGYLLVLMNLRAPPSMTLLSEI